MLFVVKKILQMKEQICLNSNETTSYTLNSAGSGLNPAGNERKLALNVFTIAKKH